MANALRDEALQATTDFLDSLVGVAFDEDGQGPWNWWSPELPIAVEACKKLADMGPAGVALYVKLLEIHDQFHEVGPNPLYLNDGEMFVAMTPVSDVKRLVKELRDGSSPVRRERPMTYMQEKVWDLLEGRCLSEKELAMHLHRSEDVVRQLISGLRRGGYSVHRREGRGYWRPDAPPPEMMASTPT